MGGNNRFFNKDTEKIFFSALGIWLRTNPYKILSEWYEYVVTSELTFSTLKIITIMIASLHEVNLKTSLSIINIFVHRSPEPV